MKYLMIVFLLMSASLYGARIPARGISVNTSSMSNSASDRLDVVLLNFDTAINSKEEGLKDDLDVAILRIGTNEVSILDLYDANDLKVDELNGTATNLVLSGNVTIGGVTRTAWTDPTNGLDEVAADFLYIRKDKTIPFGNTWGQLEVHATADYSVLSNTRIPTITSVHDFATNLTANSISAQMLIEDYVYSSTTNDTFVDIQEIIDSIPKNLNGFNLTFNFDGVYVNPEFESGLTFSGFYGGTVIISGGVTGSTNQTTTFKTDGDLSDPLLNVVNCSDVTIQGIHFDSSLSETATTTVQIIGCAKALVQLCYFLRTDQSGTHLYITSTGGAAVSSSLFERGVQAIHADNASVVSVSNCGINLTAPNYAIRATGSSWVSGEGSTIGFAVSYGSIDAGSILDYTPPEALPTYVLINLGTPPTGAGNKTEPHGLGSNPDQISFYFECVTADAGYSPGDRIVPSTIGASSIMYTIFSDGTNVGYVTTHAPRINTKGTGTAAVATAASWNIYIRAVKY